MTKLPPEGSARTRLDPHRRAETYELIHDDEGRPVAALHQGPGPDGWWWATILEGSFVVLGPADCRDELEAKVRRRCGRPALAGGAL